MTLESECDEFLIPIVKDSIPSMVAITISNVPLEYPINMQIDVGNDSISDWRFENFGMCDRFAGNETNISDVVSGNAPIAHIKVPKSAVSHASLSIVANSSTNAYELALLAGEYQAWYANSLDNQFANAEAIVNGKAMYSMAFVDWNLDGKKDIFIGNDEGNLNYSLSNNDSYMSGYIPLVNFSGVIVDSLVDTNLSEDAYPDLFACTRGGSFYVVYNTGNSDMPQYKVTLPADIFTIDSIDFNNDSSMDAVASGSQGIFYILRNNGNTSFSNITQSNSTTSSILALDCGDLDGNGYPDIVGAAMNGSLYVCLNEGINLSSPVRIPASTFSLYSIKLAMLNNDTYLDILAGNSKGGLFVLFGNGDGTFQQPIALQAGAQMITSVTAADLNKDNVLDLIAGSRDGRIYYSLNNGYGNFSRICSAPAGNSYVMAVETADMDDDNDTDVIAANYNGNIYILRNNLEGVNETIDFTQALRSYVVNATPVVDEWGNPMVTVPINITSQYPVNITLSNLNVTYDYTAHINVLPQVIAYVASHPANATGFVNVPVRISSSTPGKVRVSIEINYSRCAPWLGEPIPDSYAFDEDTYGYHLIDLERYFCDDKDDGNLTFFVAYEEEPAALHAMIDGHYLSFQPSPQWTGTRNFSVKAVDREGLQFTSNVFTVTVRHVNHPPVFSDVPTSLRVVENQSSWLPISSYASDLDGDAIYITASDNVNVTLHSNGSAELRFSGAGYDRTIAFIASDGNSTAIVYVLITVTPYGTPVWSALPEYNIPRGCNITEQTANYSLREHVHDVDTPINDLAFSVVGLSGAPTGANVSVSSSGMLIVSKPTNYVGTFTVTLRVSDGAHYDDAELRITVRAVQLPPVYLGGLTSATVDEDTTWSADLSLRFSNPDAPGMMYYSSNSDAIKVVGSIACWTPTHGSSNITNLIFTAYDMENTSFTANSTPITLTFREVNDRPVYLGGMQSAIIYEGMTWTIDLAQFFSDEENPEGLEFSCNSPSVSITGSNASWSPKLGDGNVTDLVFTAVDANDDSLNVSSTPINLVFVPKNKQPHAQIIKISPSKPTTETVVSFEGAGTDTDGRIIAWEWKDNTGVLEHTAEFTCRLGAGKHAFTFRVEDDKGLWSDYAYANLTVAKVAKPKPAQQMPYLFFGILGLAGALICLGITMNIRGRKRLKRLK